MFSCACCDIFSCACCESNKKNAFRKLQDVRFADVQQRDTDSYGSRLPEYFPCDHSDMEDCTQEFGKVAPHVGL
jgi:hypothetical protein